MPNRYLYKGRLYSDDREDRTIDNYEGDLDDLLFELITDDKTGSDIYTCEVTSYYINGEYFGSDEDVTTDEIIDALVDYGYDGLEVSE